MATLHLMVGLPCSGKTTRARQLETAYRALRLTPDEWQLRLFGDDTEDAAHDHRHTVIEGLLWGIAERVLALGLDVILDFGFWSQQEREDYRARAARLGAASELHVMEAAPAVLVERLRVRNAQRPAGTPHIPEAMLLGWIPIFEPPTPDERQRRG